MGWKKKFQTCYVFLVLKIIYFMLNNLINLVEEFTLSQDYAHFKKKLGQVITKCRLEYDLHKLRDIFKPKQKALDILVITQISEANIWNLGLGHIHKKRLKKFNQCLKI
jgi:hypothetical protein